MNNNGINQAATLVLLMISSTQGVTQGFVNLDFEDAVIALDTASPFYPHAANLALALPGWTPTAGFVGPSNILYDSVSIGSASVSLHDADGFVQVLQGAYSVLLQPNAVTLSPAAITQVGLVPFTAQSLMFFGDGGFFVVTFAGQPIALSAVSTTPTYTVYAGDISAYAGVTGELRIQGNGTVDAISFAVPEPSALSLFGLGALSLGWLRRPRGF